MNKKEKARYDKILGDKKVYEMTEEELLEPITKEMGNLCRHRLEKRWYRRLVIINFLIIFVVILLFIDGFTNNMYVVKEYANQFVEDFNSSDSEDDSEEELDGEAYVEKIKNDKQEALTQLDEDDLPLEVVALFYGIIILVAGYIGLYAYYAAYRSMSLRITENNFPEVYRTIEEYSRRLGMAVPKAYVMQSNGVLNAFSTFLFRRQWIAINSEIFEVAYREHKDMDALNFVIAHELAHIYYGHATLHYNLPIWFSMNIPILGSIASRTREYSSDRLAQRLTGNEGIEAMLVLVVDRHLYKMVDKEDYIEEMKSVKGFFVWCYNLLADHPVMSKRVVALHEGRGSGKLY